LDALMSTPRRVILLGGAVIALTMAALLVVHTGLPDRAVFSAEFFLPDGRPVAPEIGAVAPAFQLVTFDGHSVDLSKLRGSPVVVNFWATWCEPCRVEMPQLQALYDAHRRGGLKVVGVNRGDTGEQVRGWAQELALTFDLALDPQDRTALTYHLRGQPSTYIISPTGTITAIFYGPTTKDALEAALAPYITS
jgi:peroxiredoxin